LKFEPNTLKIAGGPIPASQRLENFSDWTEAGQPKTETRVRDEMRSESIDDVISRLDEIIERCHTEGSRLGFFPAMYRKTTLEVKRGLEAGRFEDPDRMELLDVVFAERYLDAYREHERGERPTGAWEYAFRAGHSARPSVIQHLLLGMNAHINLDLGISAVKVAPGDSLVSLKHDFDEINCILGELVDRVQDDIASVFPVFRALDFLCLRLDEAAVHLAVRQARATAWRKALALARTTSAADRETHIATFDRETVELAKAICPPSHLSPDPSLAGPGSGRRSRDPGEVKTVRRIIEALLD
jgi:hypothetical protein